MTASAAKLPPVAVLEEMYRTRAVVDAEGKTRRLHSEVAAPSTWALYQTVLRLRPQLVVEIGMAFGASTLSILAGLAELGTGKLISIDPGQTKDFSRIGVNNVRRAGFAAYHELIEAPSFLALPELLRAGTAVDMGYIDGWHSFDYTLLDFFYLDKMLGVGGCVGFNDCAYPSVRKVLGFVNTHRRYDAYDAGLRRDYQGRNILYTAARFMLGLRREDRYFRKREDFVPPWDYFENF